MKFYMLFSVNKIIQLLSFFSSKFKYGSMQVYLNSCTCMCISVCRWLSYKSHCSMKIRAVTDVMHGVVKKKPGQLTFYLQRWIKLLFLFLFGSVESKCRIFLEVSSMYHVCIVINNINSHIFATILNFMSNLKVASNFKHPNISTIRHKCENIQHTWSMHWINKTKHQLKEYMFYFLQLLSYPKELPKIHTTHIINSMCKPRKTIYSISSLTT